MDERTPDQLTDLMQITVTRRRAVGIVAALATLLPTSARAQVGVPIIKPPRLTISVDAGSNIATVTVVGKIEFTEFNRNQMEQGIRFAVGCEIWEEDDPPQDSDDFCFDLQGSDSADYLYFPTDESNPAEEEDLVFTAREWAGELNKDDNDWTRNFEDEIYARLEIWASDGGDYERIGDPVRSYDRIDRRF